MMGIKKGDRVFFVSGSNAEKLMSNKMKKKH